VIPYTQPVPAPEASWPKAELVISEADDGEVSERSEVMLPIKMLFVAYCAAVEFIPHLFPVNKQLLKLTILFGDVDEPFIYPALPPLLFNVDERTTIEFWVVMFAATLRLPFPEFEPGEKRYELSIYIWLGFSKATLTSNAPVAEFD